MSALEEQLCSELAARLGADGWSSSEGRSQTGTASFIRSVDPQFSATADVWLREADGGKGVTIDSVWVGVIYEPLRRLWPLCGDRFRWSLLATEYDEEDLPDLHEEEEWQPLFVVRGPADVASAASGAAGLIAQRWQPFVARLRAPGEDDLIVSATYDGPSIELGPPEGDAVLETDAAARALLLWGRQPADPSRIRSNAGPDALGAARRLLAGY